MDTPTGYDTELLGLPLYDDAHRALAAEADAWCQAHHVLWDEVRTLDPHTAGRRLTRALGAAGWFTGLDPAPGARPTGLREICLRREILAHAEDLADFAYAIQALAATPLLRHGTEQQRAAWLPGLADGTRIGAFAVSEQEAGSDLAAVALAAERQDDGSYVLDGRKAWIANATIADVFVVIARTGPGPGALGLSALLVPADTPGLRVEPVAAIAPRSFGHLHFEDCRLPAEALLGRRGRGFVVAVDLLERFRTTVGAAALGFARRAFDTALAHTRARAAYGATLFDLQLVKGRLADMEIELAAAGLLVARAAWETDRGSRSFARHSNMAKVHATEAAQQVVDSAVQLMGAAGIVQDSITERLYRQIRSLRLYEGPTEVLKTAIANSR
ncbi:acyl-CoA dehydrogenase family protein [Streptomyces sp. NPDC089919]|uniref:acyl-CoA dehydrogenase family protein n=1 Tax=Streptomyces sp. NPDC089919 TaxID=3155188 RepID=UPI003435E07D